jgi:dolichol-phosphate mannosyltransferase
MPPPPSEPALPRVAVVVPALDAERWIGQVLEGIPERVSTIVVVDDGSQDRTAELVRASSDPRVSLLRHRANRGVGAAMLTGYARALELEAEVVVKIDADGQMDPAHLERLIAPLCAGAADYAKGNRFLHAFPPPQMPPTRFLGNLGLTFLTKFASGYWNLFDPTNGYTAIHADALRRIDPSRVAQDYFFEISFLLELRRHGAVVSDVPIPARYGEEESALSVPRALMSFPPRLVSGTCRRLVRQYLLYDFSAASLLGLLGVALSLAGTAWGGAQWYLHASAGRFASSGTVLLSVLPIILGVYSLVQALVLDNQSVPKRPIAGQGASGLPAPPLTQTLAGYAPQLLPPELAPSAPQPTETSSGEPTSDPSLAAASPDR